MQLAKSFLCPLLYPRESGNSTNVVVIYVQPFGATCWEHFKMLFKGEKSQPHVPNVAENYNGLDLVPGHTTT